jgi:hypothetical protein
MLEENVDRFLEKEYYDVPAFAHRFGGQALDLFW